MHILLNASTFSGIYIHSCISTDLVVCQCAQLIGKIDFAQQTVNANQTGYLLNTGFRTL